MKTALCSSLTGVIWQRRSGAVSLQQWCRNAASRLRARSVNSLFSLHAFAARKSLHMLSLRRCGAAVKAAVRWSRSADQVGNLQVAGLSGRSLHANPVRSRASAVGLYVPSKEGRKLGCSACVIQGRFPVPRSAIPFKNRLRPSATCGN